MLPLEAPSCPISRPQWTPYPPPKALRTLQSSISTKLRHCLAWHELEADAAEAGGRILHTQHFTAKPPPPPPLQPKRFCQLQPSLFLLLGELAFKGLCVTW